MSRIYAAVLCLALAAPISSNARSSGADSTLHHRMDSLWQKRNMPFIGLLYSDFKASMPDGGWLTNDAFYGKITLLLFWYPSCNCFDFDRLQGISKLMQERPDFQVISIMPDTADLAVFRQSHPVFGKIGNLQSHAKAQELNFGNGIPSYILLDRRGIITKIGRISPAPYNETDLNAAIRELLMY